MIIDGASVNNTTKEPDWQGSGSELLNTIRRVKDKMVRRGFLEIDLPYEFSDTFRYSVVIEVESSGSVIESVAIAFRIDKDMDATKSAIEESVIVPEVLSTFTRDNLMNYFADIVEKQSRLAFYLNRKPRKFENLKFYELTNEQKVVFNEFLVMAIEKVLIERKKKK
jgi:hypothetical protein